VDLGELHHVLDPELCESHDAVLANAIDPNDAVLDFHYFVGDVAQLLLVFAEHLSEAIDRGDMMDLVDMHGHTA